MECATETFAIVNRQHKWIILKCSNQIEYEIILSLIDEFYGLNNFVSYANYLNCS